jgi:hypothetical protein
MLYSRGNRFERNFKRASRSGDEYYFGVQDKEEYDEYEEDEFV